MARPKRTPIQRELDLARIAALYLKQKTQREIAAELGLSQNVIHRDLAEISRRWREMSLIDMHEAKQRELARIDQLEREYWDAWQRSQQESIKTRTTRSAREGDSASVTHEPSDGNPAFLQGVQNCIDQRCRILGIYQSAKILDWRSALEGQGIDAGEVFEQMVAVAKRILGGT